MGVHDMDRYDEVKRLLGIPEDEPIFVLRAQDKYAAVAVEDYVHTVYVGERGVSGQASSDLRAWRDKGFDHANSFYEWQDVNPDKIKTPD